MKAPVRHPVQTSGDLDGDLIVSTEVGGPLDPANLRPTLRRMARQAGIPGDWTVYSLRHTAVSVMSDSGVSIEQIADAAGHRNSQVTSVVYRHAINPTVTSTRESVLFRDRETS